MQKWMMRFVLIPCFVLSQARLVGAQAPVQCQTACVPSCLEVCAACDWPWDFNETQDCPPSWPAFEDARFSWEGTELAIVVNFDRDTLKGSIPSDTNGDWIPDEIDWCEECNGLFDCSLLFTAESVRKLGEYPSTECSWTRADQLRITLHDEENRNISAGDLIFIRPLTLFAHFWGTRRILEILMPTEVATWWHSTSGSVQVECPTADEWAAADPHLIPECGGPAQRTTQRTTQRPTQRASNAAWRVSAVWCSPLSTISWSLMQLRMQQ